MGRISRIVDIPVSLAKIEGLPEEIVKRFVIVQREVLIKQKSSQNKKESCLLYTSPSPRDLSTSRMPSSA